MASLYCDVKGHRAIQFFAERRRRKTIRLGQVSEKTAEKILTKVEALIKHVLGGQPLASEVAKWIRQTERAKPELYDKLAAVGLVASREATVCPTVVEFVDRYIAARSDVKPSTAIIYGYVRRNLNDYFGADRQLDSLTAGEADDWRRWLAKAKNEDDPKAGGEGLSPETVRQRCRVAKQIFRDAVRRKQIDESPFADMKGVSAKGNREKDYFITRDEAAKVLAACPDYEWQLLFALSRYGGLRCPSEHLLLRWRDINWDRGRIIVIHPKPSITKERPAA
jgi:hypothetical protein